jgi:nucleotide-binding universal stress UspA family protein
MSIKAIAPSFRKLLPNENHVVRGKAMFAHLLIATDGSELAAKAESTGLKLAEKLGARVTAVTATEPRSAMSNGGALSFDFPIEAYEKAAAQHATAILAKVHEAAAKLGVACESAHVIDFAADAIIETARVKGCDLIVMASHGRRGVKQLLLGSQAQRVVSLSSLPVLVCR